MAANQPLTNLPPKSGVTAVLDATGVIDRQVEHAANLQAAIDEIRELATHWADTVPGQPFARRAGKRILAALEQHHV